MHVRNQSMGLLLISSNCQCCLVFIGMNPDKVCFTALPKQINDMTIKGIIFFFFFVFYKSDFICSISEVYLLTSPQCLLN